MAKAKETCAVIEDTRETIRMTFIGTRPLLMHSERLADPTDEMAVALKKVSGIRKKTDDHYAQMMRIEFLGGIYYDPEVGVHVPDLVILATLREGAKLRRLGTIAERSLDIAETMIPLIYDGPRTPEKLLEKKEFRDRRTVCVNTSRVTRTRPRFNEWSLSFDLIYDPEQLDRETVVTIAQDAGLKIGMGDFRPRFGRFSVEAE